VPVGCSFDEIYGQLYEPDCLIKSLLDVVPISVGEANTVLLCPPRKTRFVRTVSFYSIPFHFVR
jgi:hypothetical protein